MVELKTYKGVEITVTDDGQFRASYAGEWHSADTLKALEAKIDKLSRKTKVKVSVPFTILDRVWNESKYGAGHWGAGIGVRHMVATGIHAKTGALLAKDDNADGKVEQLDRWERSAPRVRRLNELEVAMYVDLAERQQAAEEAYREFTSSVSLDVIEKVKSALSNAVDDPKEDPSKFPDPEVGLDI